MTCKGHGPDVATLAKTVDWTKPIRFVKSLTEAHFIGFDGEYAIARGNGTSPVYWRYHRNGRFAADPGNLSQIENVPPPKKVLVQYSMIYTWNGNNRVCCANWDEEAGRARWAKDARPMITVLKEFTIREEYEECTCGC